MESILIVILGLLVGFRIAQIIYNKKTHFLYKQMESYIQESKKEKEAPRPLEDKIWHQQETEFIFKLHEYFATTFDKQKLIQYIVDKIADFLYVEKTILLLLDKVRNGFIIGYSVGVDKKSIEDFFLIPTESVSGYAVEEGKTILVNDFKKEAYLERINKEPYFKKSFIIAPIIFKSESYQKETLGILIVCDKKSLRPFSKKEENFLTNVARVSAVVIKNSQLNEQMQEDYIKTISALALALDARDPYTRWHSENVTRYSVEIAKAMGCTLSYIETVRRAALLHDIGKIGIPDNILLKQGKLTDEEFQQIKLHPVKGENIIKTLPFLKEVSSLVRHHHERYDGKGYPDKIQGKKIELGAAILAVADSFDAMISDRPYRKALSLEEAINELKVNKGKQFFPQVVDCFLNIIENNPSILKAQTI
mgnify:CR=1 FL=1